MRKLTTQEWVEKAIQIHGDKYDYSKVDYKGSTFKVTIICKEHGEFDQNSHDHLCNKGCKECGKLKQGSNKSNILEFIQKSNLIHNNFYNYSKSIYNTSKDKILIICPVHGEFLQTAGDHLEGKGCLKCGRIKNIFARTKSLDDFIKCSSKVHANYYNYDFVKYITTHTKVVISCPIHGKFLQSPNKHLKGQGCPKCMYKNQQKLFDKLQKDCKQELVYEYSPDWLGRQRFDMYFLKYNIAVEYNGKQHQVPIKHFGGDVGFQKTQERDNIKRQKCKDNDCVLFEVKYDYDENDYEELVNNINSIIKLKQTQNEN